MLLRPGMIITKSINRTINEISLIILLASIFCQMLVCFFFLVSRLQTGWTTRGFTLVSALGASLFRSGMSGVYMLSIQFLICYRHRPNIASTMNTFCTSVSTTPCLSRCGASYASICWRETLASFSASSLHRPANSTAVVRRTKSRTNLATRP